MKYAIRPEDILSDKENFTSVQGVALRKGTIAAFVKNLELLEKLQGNQDAQKELLGMLKELAPGIILTGLYAHVQFKNPVIDSILAETQEEIMKDRNA